MALNSPIISPSLYWLTQDIMTSPDGNEELFPLRSHLVWMIDHRHLSKLTLNPFTSAFEIGNAQQRVGRGTFG